MKESFKEQSMEEKLPDYFDGKLSTDEQQQVEEWMEASTENERMARHFYTICLAADTVQRADKIDTEQALQQVKRQMRRKLYFNKIWKWTQFVAAVLFLPLVTGMVYFYRESKTLDKGVAQVMSITTGPGITSSVVLPDSTVVYLNSETSLHYPSAFNGKTRQVDLSGEAYFKVTRHTEQPFIVSTPHHSAIRVLGTEFNIDAYEKNFQVTTTLMSGKLGFVYNDGVSQNDKQVLLNPHEKLVYDSSTRQLQLRTTDGQVETAWKEGKVIFNNTAFADAIRILEKRYGVIFQVKNPRLYNHAFTGQFSNQRIDRILEFFRISSRVQWRYINKEDFTDKKNIIELY